MCVSVATPVGVDLGIGVDLRCPLFYAQKFQHLFLGRGVEGWDDKTVGTFTNIVALGNIEFPELAHENTPVFGKIIMMAFSAEVFMEHPLGHRYVHNFFSL